MQWLPGERARGRESAQCAPWGGLREDVQGVQNSTAVFGPKKRQALNQCEACLTSQYYHSIPRSGYSGEEILLDTKRKNEKGEVEVAICPLCDLRVEFIGAPMVRCYSTGETYELEEIIWILESKVSKDIGYDVENIRGNDKEQDFLPNAYPAADDK